jgi:hypothetical protein
MGSDEQDTERNIEEENGKNNTTRNEELVGARRCGKKDNMA